MKSPLSSALYALIATELVLMFVWVFHHLGGVGRHGTPTFFNWHPLLMTIAVAGIMPLSVVAYTNGPFKRVPGGQRPARKLLHAALHGTAFLLALVGVIFVFLFHGCPSTVNGACAPSFPNMYSVHSWMGMATMVAFFLQLAAGGYAYLYHAKSRALWKTMLMPFHRYFGLAAWLMATLTVCVGLMEKQAFIPGDQFSSSKTMANVMAVGMLLINLVAGAHLISAPISEAASSLLTPA